MLRSEWARMPATTGQRHFPTVEWRRARRGTLLWRLRLGTGQPPFIYSVLLKCSVWVFSVSGDGPSNQKDVCTLPEMLCVYTIILPEIWALRDSSVSPAILPRKPRCKTFFICMSTWLFNHLLPGSTREHGNFSGRPFWESWIMTQSWRPDGGTQEHHEQVSAAAAGAGW